ncbi:hypothetical protein [Candidatus Nitrososphaera sp. FF02]|uniref:hypothetical protein n=1 Tax=Candidatus Nitrososphaera sp. FF02 TaxID=3398226 RepID=UPI0039E83F5E
MPRENQRTVTVSGKALKTLNENFEKEKQTQPSLKFASFIADSAIMELERKNILREAQQIAFIGFQDNIIIMKDYRKKEKFVEVQIKDKKLHCLEEDDKDECIHVGFALALPEVRKALNK